MSGARMKAALERIAIDAAKREATLNADGNSQPGAALREGRLSRAALEASQNAGLCERLAAILDTDGTA